MAEFEYDIGVLGSGAAGLTVAAGSAQLGARCLLIEKEEVLGGDCLHYGCVPSKTLIRSAHVYHMMRNARRYGLPDAGLKPVVFGDVAARIQAVIGQIQKHDSVERFCGMGAQVEFGSAVFVDEHTVRLNGRDYSARSWVLSTGSGPATAPVEGMDETPFITNKEIFSLEELPKSMITIGAGPIACEMAQAFARLGTRVMVVQRSGQILSREDKDMADMVMEVMRAEGVEFYLNSRAIRARDLGDQRELLVEHGGRELSLRADRILVALGRRANLGGLGLEDIGLEYTAKGIEVDGRLRTAHKHIYAAGDTTGANQFTHAAGYEGGIVVSNAIFRLPRKADYTWLPWCTYTDPELASIGMNEKRAREAGIDYTVWTEEFRDNDRSLAEEEHVGRIKLLLGPGEKPLGVQILGPQAGELLGEWVAFFNGKVKLSGIAGAIHPYPTLGEINKKVISDVFARKIYSEKVRKGLKFFFHLKGRASCR